MKTLKSYKGGKSMIVLSVVAGVILLITINYLINPTNLRFQKAISRTNGYTSENKVITEEDIDHLPPAVKRYLNYVGVVGRYRVNIADFKMHGRLKLNPESDFQDVHIKQTSGFQYISRLFYITMKLGGIGIRGIHLYENAKAIMVIKILDLIKVADANGEYMDKGETVTVFNDFCILAPMSLIDERISWEEIDNLHVKGTFSNDGITVAAILTFDEEGRLINFYSEDRYSSTTGKNYEKIPWSTPVSEYQIINGLNLVKRAEAVWHMEDGDFVYADFIIDEVVFR